VNLLRIKLANSFILISGCDLFFIIMIVPKKRKAFSIQEKMDILAQVDANKETSVALAARLGIAPSTLNTIVKSRKDNEKCYVQCGRFSGQRKSLKQSPFEELESLLATWFKQARGSNAVISVTLLREKDLHIATRLGIENFKASNGWINGFKHRHSAVYKTVSGECKCGGMEKGAVTQNF
jgi:hypothetical protein